MKGMTTAMVAAMGLAAVTLVAASAANRSSPYTGLESRSVKALSSEETRGLLAGEGMALSLAAELNGYPGPRHVLELAHDLALTASQEAHAAALQAEMKREAVALGAAIVALEEQLDALFREGKAEPDQVAALSAEIGAKRGLLRAVHLRAHLAMAKVLSDTQRTRYAALRGYHNADGSAPADHRPHHKH